MKNIPLAKIIVSISRFNSDKEKIIEFLNAGTRIFRLNLSHGTRNEHIAMIELLRSVSKELNMVISICLDTKGPELRLEMYECSEKNIRKGEVISFSNKRKSNSMFIPLSDLSIVAVGSIIYIDDGYLPLEIVESNEDSFQAKALGNRRISNNKKISLPGIVFQTEESTKKDIEDIELAKKMDADAIFLSFVNVKSDVTKVRDILGNKKMLVFSKIETQKGCKNLDEILEVSDGVIIARGDLCVEVEHTGLFEAQKTISEKAFKANIPCICATEMMISMVNSPKPTRAEIMDIGNAIFDHCDGMMLTEETAIGKYPISCVEYMNNLICATETVYFKRNEDKVRNIFSSNLKERAAGIIKIKNFLEIDILRRERLHFPLYVISSDKKTLSLVNMHRGIFPFYEKGENEFELVRKLRNELKCDIIFKYEVRNNRVVKFEVV